MNSLEHLGTYRDRTSPGPMITTIIPTYRRPQRLRKAILSVLDQTYPDFQVCVYDNASGDETPDIVAQIARDDSRVTYHCHPENIGGIANFNFGMARVTSPYFSVLSDDNTLLPTFFEDALYSLKQYPQVVCYAGRTIAIDEEGKINHKWPHKMWGAGIISPPDGLIRVIEKGLPTSLDGILFRKEVLDKVGVFEPRFDGTVDQDYIMRIMRNHIVYISEVPSAIFLHHTGSWSENRDLVKRVTIYEEILEQWCNDKDLSEDIRQRIKRAYRRYIKNVIPSAIMEKCILGGDHATISTAKEIMMREVGFSVKLQTAILIAEAATSSHFLKKIILRVIRLLR